nr:PREDICTED: uncharacterized protein LOC105663437 [Megachile rotundata]
MTHSMQGTRERGVGRVMIRECVQKSILRARERKKGREKGKKRGIDNVIEKKKDRRSEEEGEGNRTCNQLPHSWSVSRLKGASFTNLPVPSGTPTFFNRDEDREDLQSTRVICTCLHVACTFNQCILDDY